MLAEEFLKLPVKRKLICLEAFFWLLVARILHARLPFSKLLSIPSRARRVRLPQSLSANPCDIAWAIGAVTRNMPGFANCVVQALAAQLMLSRSGHDSKLRIGVRRDERGRIQAHAWVEVEGQIIVGGPDISSYAIFPAIGDYEES